MERVNDAVAWYQHKIGTYDKQLWERSVEKRVLKSILNAPKKSAKNRTELIDVDLVRGSTFPKAKPQQGWLAVSRSGFARVVFMPLYFRWWQQQTNLLVTLVLFVLYCFQVATLCVYWHDAENELSAESLSLAHVVTPLLMMVILGLIHAHIIATHESHRPRRKTTIDATSELKTKRHRTKVKTPPNTPRSQSDVESVAHDAEKPDDSFGIRQRKFTSKTTHNLRRSCSHGKTLVSDSAANHSDEADDESDDDRKQLHKIQTRNRNSMVKSDILEARSESQHDQDNLNCDLAQRNCTCSENKHVVSGAEKETQGNEFVMLSYSHDDKDDLSNEKKDEAQGSSVKEVVSSDQVLDKSEPQMEYSGCTLETDGLMGAGFTEFTGEFVHQDITQAENLQPEKIEGSILRKKTENSDAPINRDSGVIIRNESDSNSETSTQGVLDSAEFEISGIPVQVCGSIINNTDGDRVPNPSQEGLENLHSPACSVPTQSPGGTIRCHSPGGTANNVVSDSVNTLKDMLSSEAKPDDETKQSNSSNKRSQSVKKPMSLNLRRERHQQENIGVSSCDSEEGTTPNTPPPTKASPHGPLPYSLTSHWGEYHHGNITQLLSLENEWGDTGNTDMTSCGDTSSNTASDSDLTDQEPPGGDMEMEAKDTNSSSGIPHIASVMNNLASSSDKVSCMIWEEEEVKKIDLTVLDIGWTIINKVDKIPETCDYLVLGLVFSLKLLLLPVAFRCYQSKDKLEPTSLSLTQHHIHQAQQVVFGQHWSQAAVLTNGMIQRCFLGFVLFFLLSVAERTFKQRLLYAKHFCYLTSSRRAKKYELPHFRLNKVRNIKTWLSLRSYLKKRGPQRSVDTIVSAAFILEVIMVSIMCFQLLQDSEGFLDHLGNWELMLWCMALAIYLLRFMTLGTKINRKYRNFSVLITEQINLYLQMEQKPHKKEELMMANSVLKLAEALLKELEIPFKISGLSANPFLYNITKVILLSAFSAVLTELLGFKLKLYKIKLRA